MNENVAQNIEVGNGKEMTREREETLKLTMFPLMLQALYNAQFYINKKTEGTDWRFEENSETNKVGEAFRQMEDLRLIIRAFRDAGIAPRCPMEEVQSRHTGVKMFRMRHFSEMEKDHVLQLFNPDKSDYEATMEAQVSKAQPIIEELQDQIRVLDDEVHKWKSIAGGETGELKRDFCVKHNMGLIEVIDEIGDPEVYKMLEDLPCCTSVQDFRMMASCLKGRILTSVQFLRSLKRKFHSRNKSEGFDVLSGKADSDGEA